MLAGKDPVRVALTVLATAALGFAATSAYADEPRSATEPRVMMQGGDVTHVISSFDEGDPFSLNVSLGFEYFSKSAKVLRETAIAQPGLTTGGYTSRLMNVAKYSSTMTKLTPRIDIGLYHDLALYFRLPIILSYAQQLGDLDGTKGRESVVAQGAPGETLFTLPFKSPDRSGVEYLAVGLDVDVLSQARDRTKPTWLLGLEGRFSVGEPMHACNPSQKPGQVSCANPADIDRDGTSNSPFEGANVSSREPGVTRGTIGLEVHTILSKRMKYVEPYGGFAALFEFQQSSSDFGLTDLKSSLVNHPPLVGTMLLGMMIIPWENREKFQRVTFDLRFTGEYHSEGRDYSELFDALGSSDAKSLRNPQWAGYKANPSGGQPVSVVDEGSSKTYFTGLTDVAGYGSYRGSASVTWQAADMFKLQFGMGLRHDQGHGISGDQNCNPAFRDDIGKSGPCRRESADNKFTATGVPNPNYRPTINAVGRRFFIDDSNTFDVFASATLMF